MTALTETAPVDGKRPVFEWVVLLCSWTYALASYRKRGRSGEARTDVIAQMNRLYLVISVVLVAAMIAYGGNSLASIQGGRLDAGIAFSCVAFALASYCLSRGIDIFYAFYRDAFEKLAERPARSDLDGHRRIRGTDELPRDDPQLLDAAGAGAGGCLA